MRPFRDSDNVNQAWKKNRQISDNLNALSQTVRKMSREMSKSRRKPLGGFVPPPSVQQEQYPAPFQFYGVTPNNGFAINAAGTGYAVNDVVTISGGALSPGSSATTITITSVSTTGIVLGISVATQGSYSMPPVYPNAVTGGTGNGLTVTAISSADAWRTVQMRDGLIGLRPRFTAPGENTTQGISPATARWPGFFNSSETIFGNFQQYLRVSSDGLTPFAPASPSTGTAIMLGAVNTPVLISGFIGTDYVSYSQIILPASLADESQFSFWLQVVDSLILPSEGLPFQYVQLWGQTNGAEAVVPFPRSDAENSNPDSIPVASIGIFGPNGGGVAVPGTIGQFLSGNLINLFDSYFSKTTTPSGLAAGAKMNFRGNWTNDELAGQYFYPGDIVQDVVNKAGSNVGTTIYVCMNYVPGAVTAPNLDGVNWLPIVY